MWSVSPAHTGWVCPKCGKVYAPFVPECSDCGKERKITKEWTAGGKQLLAEG